MKKILLITAVILGGFWSLAHAEIVATDVDYQSGETKLKGYLVYDDSIKTKRPGILVVHEWWGLNDYARKRAEMLAELGYTAFAIDMYGDGKTAEHPDDASGFANQVSANMNSIGKERFLAALEALKAHPMVDANKIAAIGYCFGGGTVLHMARYGVDLKGVVSFHGSLKTETPAQPGDIKAKILVCHGAADKFTSPEDVQAFKDEMGKAGADYKFISYEGAMHGFTNPNADELAKKFDLPIAYNSQADKQSWEDMKQFFDGVFK